MNAKRFGSYGGSPRLAYRLPDFWIAKKSAKDY
jgi:hypothetical protein